MPAQPSQNSPADGLRADARHNRARILQAARAAYAAHGIDVPVTTIARRAGVGVATLYRRFPTRDALVAEAFTEQFQACAAVLDEALADPDPWRGFRSLVERVCAMQARDRGFTAAFLARFPGLLDPGGERERAEQKLALLVRRAQEAGVLRPDFDPSDVVLVLLANNGLTGADEAASLAASRRLTAYLLASFRAGPAADGARRAALPPPAPVELRQLHEGA
ncbi:TetR/AcrR family transcriptional regulator [Streptomyces sp. CHA1]|uniref:TetR/AcrR family transcriptional regulator n=1 Tax=Streptomyces TaxID=1883 RepID=UPI00053E5182|nr:MULTISPECIES: TetR/AcrR family transcriptional regulator [unclassified Streptomyces]MBT3156996.1 TetR/AcrR family transcriptional regulator [Streptomyces sp. G11C]MCO6702930.1 TetR/AcrR family transcriptional regulator [Streptomyces sp. CHB9.2]MCO6709368.1 TetR/AcrR family transcriptional regulator [Streptomyces sp. CHA3]MCO6715111.1 TetR/AcrR family transcriptional regulator [Streptomyces sp. CHB19.2]MCO6721236.1 TetR/AcrR family transcriptional regulator [Streptomyces sp. Vc714c-19]